MQRLGIFLAITLPFVIMAASLDAQPGPQDPYAKKVAQASNEWKKTLKRMQLPAGVHADLWAAEPHVANIVAFHFDEKGRCYVAETFRLHAGVTDNRSHAKVNGWLDDDLACRTVADRVAMYKKHLKGKFASYAVEQDRVRIVEDSTGQGRADKSTVFTDGFKNTADGIGSGVLASHGKVWYTCIPDLWFLQDTKGTGRADIKKSLHTGFGVHTAFIGHDMHGLRFGPDGKLYFSIGDRGLNIADAKIAQPDTGSVLRCNPDGSELEIFATGLRNPQELAFDEFGNLFTGDNNADGGDKARWVHLVPGGDSGWRIGYQYLKGLGVWNQEKLWHTQPTNTAAYLLPPLAHIGNGPSGLTYHPGTSLLPKKYAKHFFLCDFRGSGGGSGIHAFTLSPKGASFQVNTPAKFAWSVLATDCDFGPDGGFYVSDWHEGWGTPNKGRIYKLFDPNRSADPTVAQVKKLLAAGFSQRAEIDLSHLLDHPDQRVRQEAQFALADKASVAGILQLGYVSRHGKQLARLHAIWALGQIARKKLDTNPQPLDIVKDLTDDPDPEVRSQALKVLGESRATDAKAAVLAGLKDKEPRVRFHAAMAAAKIGDAAIVPAVFAMLQTNKDDDAYLRHAGVMALAGIADRAALKQAALDSSPPIRLASVLAMRRLHMPEAALFLGDIDPKIVLEAARAIYDEPIPTALPKLAQMTTLPAKDLADPVLLRALAANYRLGGKANAQALVKAATRSDLPTSMREQALKMLQAWEKPSGRDWVVGLWRPLPARPGADVADALRPALAALMTGPDKIKTEGAKLAAKHGMKEIGPALRELAMDTKRPSAVRIEALQALASIKDPQLDQSAKLALGDADPRLRNQARLILLLKAPKADAVKALALVLDKGTTIERQGALAIVAKLKTSDANDLLEHWVDQLVAKKAPPELALDILLAARDSKEPSINDKLAKYEASRDVKNPLSVYRESSIGGDADIGRKIFFEKSEVSCLRCHKINGVGGEVGPDLTGIGKKQKRAYLLESLVEPNKQIAKGYETTVITLSNGMVKSGILKSEDTKEVRLMNAEGQILTIAKSQIDERSRGPSAMPSDLVQKLSRAEVRDLVEYLASLR